eukprot:SAG31_NODE_28110_length_415_cov_0.933544_2_plen_23_part_01
MKIHKQNQKYEMDFPHTQEFENK